MQNKKYSIIIVIIFFLIGFLLINQPSKNLRVENKPENIKFVKIAGQDVRVDLALTITEQEKGLGGRSGLKENEGMLFIFPEPGNYGFWMAGMNFPLDMIWLDENMKVIYIKKDARPESYPEMYGPDKSLQNTK